MDALTGLDESSDHAYNQAWTVLAARFGDVDDRLSLLGRFDQRQQGINETVAEYDFDLRKLHHQAWLTASVAQRDEELKRRFEENLNSDDLHHHLRLHFRDATYGQTVKQARRLEESKKSSKSVKINDTPTVHAIRDTRVGDDLPDLTVQEALRTTPVANAWGHNAPRPPLQFRRGPPR